MDLLIEDISLFIYLSMFWLVFRLPLENLILEKPTVGWIIFFLLLISGWIIFLIPNKFLIEETDKPASRSVGLSIIWIGILVILISVIFYYIPEWKFLNGQSLFDFYKSHKGSFDQQFYPMFEMLGIYNKRNFFIAISFFAEWFVVLGIIYTRAKKWLILIPIFIFTAIALNKFNYNSVFNLWLLSFSPFIVGSLMYKRRKSSLILHSETYKGD